MSESTTTRTSKLLFELDKSTLVFFPALSASNNSELEGCPDHHVSLVTVESKTCTNVEVATAFFLAQHEISDLITRIVCVHQIRPLPNPAAFEGATYLLVANRRQWDYGKLLDFHWGDERVHPCEDKWTFTFSIKSKSYSSSADQPSLAKEERRNSVL